MGSHAWLVRRYIARAGSTRWKGGGESRAAVGRRRRASYRPVVPAQPFRTRVESVSVGSQGVLGSKSRLEIVPAYCVGRFMATGERGSAKFITTKVFSTYTL